MSSEDGQGRYNYEHRKDTDFQIGESMPGTFGDSDGTLHDRLREQLTIDEQLVSEPGAKARQKEQERQEAASQAARKTESLNGQTTTLKLTESAGEGAAGQYCGHRVVVKGASIGETVLVTLRNRSGTLEGERMRLQE